MEKKANPQKAASSAGRNAVSLVAAVGASGCGLGKHESGLIAQDVPSNVGTEFLATNLAVRGAFNKRAFLSRDAALVVEPLPNRLSVLIPKNKSQRRLAPDNFSRPTKRGLFWRRFLAHADSLRYGDPFCQRFVDCLLSEGLPYGHGSL